MTSLTPTKSLLIRMRPAFTGTRRWIVLLAILVTALANAAEIEKTAYFVGSKLMFYWWPKLAVPSGWIADEQTSIDLKANVLVPKGKTFATADTIMYSRALTSGKGAMTLQAFIDADIKEMKAKQKGIQTTKASPFKTKSGQKLISYSFTVKGVSYERVAYGKEGDYCIMFVISAKTSAGLSKNLPTFQKMVETYK